VRVNGSEHRLDVDPEMPLLWVLRDELGLTGTKYGCGIGLCGSCAVLVDGVALKSCALPVAGVEGEVTTIEGLGSTDAPHVVQEEWIRHQVAQCGY
jgi:isoquinoline 1-oxidoreductase alpha subunit